MLRSLSNGIYVAAWFRSGTPNGVVGLGRLVHSFPYPDTKVEPTTFQKGRILRVTPAVKTPGEFL